MAQRQRYRSKGGFIMGSHYEAGRIVELYPQQATFFMALLELVDDAGLPVPQPPQSAQPTPVTDKPVAAAPVIEPPRLPRRRPGGSSSVSLGARVSPQHLSGQTDKVEPDRPKK